MVSAYRCFADVINSYNSCLFSSFQRRVYIPKFNDCLAENFQIEIYNYVIKIVSISLITRYIEKNH